MKSQIRKTLTEIAERVLIRTARRNLPGGSLERIHHGMYDATFTLFDEAGKSVSRMRITSGHRNKILITVPPRDMHTQEILRVRQGRKTSGVMFVKNGSPPRIGFVPTKPNILGDVWDGRPKFAECLTPENGLPDNETAAHFLCFVADAHRKAAKLREMFPPRMRKAFLEKLRMIGANPNPRL